MIAWAHSFGGGWPAPGSVATRPNAMFDNVIYFAPGEKSAGYAQHYHSCDPWHARNNTLYGLNVTLSQGMDANGLCTGKNTSNPNQTIFTLPQWQALDRKSHDVGSTWVKRMPEYSAMMDAGMLVLGMHSSGGSRSIYRPKAPPRGTQ